MSQILNLKSKFLNSLNQTLQELTMKESITILKSPIMEADGNFTSVVQTVNNDFDKSKLDTSITVDDEENKKAEEIQEKKKQLKDLVIDKIKQTLDVSDELQAVLNDLDKLNKEDHSKEWVVNKEDNTATLNDKNMRIFKQNEKLCLSHNGKIEIFNSVEELHDWLNKNNVKLPEGIAIHESAETLLNELKGWQNTLPFDYSKIGKWKDVLQTPTDASDARIGQTMSPEEADKIITQQNSKYDADYLTKKKLNKAETNTYLDRHPEEDPTKSKTVFDDVVFDEKECTTTGSLGAAMQYTADKKLNEEEIEEENKTNIIRSARQSNKALSDNKAAYTKIMAPFRKNDKSTFTADVIRDLPLYNTNPKFKAVCDQYLENNKPNADVLQALDNAYNSGYNFTADTNAIKQMMEDEPEEREQLASIFDLYVGREVSELEDIKNRITDFSNPRFNLEMARNFMPNTPQGQQLAVIRQQSPEAIYNAILAFAKEASDAGIKVNTSWLPKPNEYTNGAEYWKAFTPRRLEEYRFPLYLYKAIKDNKITSEKAQELFPRYFGVSNDIPNDIPSTNTQNLSKEQKIVDAIKQNIETEREVIQAGLENNPKARELVRNNFYAILEEPNKDEIANNILTNKKYSELVRKGILLRLMDKNVPLSAETLLNYANNLNVDVGNDYKILNKAEWENILKQYNQSKLVSNIKNALEFGAPQEQIINKVQGQEKDVQKAVASAILQDPEIDTTATKQAWEAMLESIKNKSFKEKMHVLKEALFKEDETPEDFSSGISSNMSTDTSDTSTETSSTDSNDFNSDTNADTNNSQPPSFGDININAGGFDPDEYGPALDDDNLDGLPMPTEEFVIEDVLVNKEDKSDIKVKLKNVQTGETITKNLSEIDI